MLDFTLLVLFCGVTHDNYFQRHWWSAWMESPAGTSFYGVRAFVSPDKKLFNFTTLKPCPVFLTPQSVCEGMITSGIHPFCVPDNQKLIMQS